MYIIMMKKRIPKENSVLSRNVHMRMHLVMRIWVSLILEFRYMIILYIGFRAEVCIVWI